MKHSFEDAVGASRSQEFDERVLLNCKNDCNKMCNNKIKHDGKKNFDPKKCYYNGHKDFTEIEEIKALREENKALKEENETLKKNVLALTEEKLWLR